MQLQTSSNQCFNTSKAVLAFLRLLFCFVCLFLFSIVGIRSSTPSCGTNPKGNPIFSLGRWMLMFCQAALIRGGGAVWDHTVALRRDAQSHWGSDRHCSQPLTCTAPVPCALLPCVCQPGSPGSHRAQRSSLPISWQWGVSIDEG